MTRIALTLEFDGGPYVGLQRQRIGASIQQAVEEAIESVLGERAVMHAAGRTDAGVHALAMPVHVEISRDMTPFRLMEAMNARLRDAGHPIAAIAARAVADDWHARFSCLGRRYLYRIVNRRAPLALQSGRAWAIKHPLDAEAMHRAAQILVGHHDFTTFRSVHCQSASPVKTLDQLDVARIETVYGPEIHITAAARSFLHHQVRSMVGALSFVGLGRWEDAHVAEALAAQRREALPVNAPAAGLYFAGARYAGWDEVEG